MDIEEKKRRQREAIMRYKLRHPDWRERQAAANKRYQEKNPNYRKNTTGQHIRFNYRKKAVESYFNFWIIYAYFLKSNPLEGRYWYVTTREKIHAEFSPALSAEYVDTGIARMIREGKLLYKKQGENEWYSSPRA